MLMNSADRPATVVYGPSDYRIVRPGQYVVCAVSGERIDLRRLTYWSAEHQEAYVSADAATQRLTGPA